MLRENLKQEIDQLNSSQLKKVANFVSSIKAQTQPTSLRQHATSVARAQDFREWVAQLPKSNISLDNEAFDRGSIYE